MTKKEYFDKNKLLLSEFVVKERKFTKEGLWVWWNHKEDNISIYITNTYNIKCNFCKKKQEEIISLKQRMISSCCWDSEIEYWGDDLICYDCFIYTNLRENKKND